MSLEIVGATDPLVHELLLEAESANGHTDFHSFSIA